MTLDHHLSAVMLMIIDLQVTSACTTAHSEGVDSYSADQLDRLPIGCS